MKITFKTACLILILFQCFSSNAQNLLDMQEWKAGVGSILFFHQNGGNAENLREWGEGPHGNRVILWKASPDGIADADGGWNSGYVAVDHQKMYRFCLWLKKTNSNDGSTFFGCETVNNLDNTPNYNPYFWYGDLPELNKWYLLVGYIHGSDDATTINYGAIYDGITGAKVNNITDFKFVNATPSMVFRSYLFYDPNVNDRQYFYAPRVDVVNGNEPSIPALLGISGASGNTGYFAGKVGIKTTNPGDFDLAVNGKIRSREIKVDNGNWADFVFERGYQLPSLQKVENHIKAKGHLPGIPSAAEVKKNGVELSDMNAKLLQKIEELTLYIIQQQKEIENLKQKSNKR